MSSVDTWVTPPRTATGLGSATIWLLAAPLPAISGGRSTFVFVDGQSYRIDQRPRVDTDGDGLPDAWETRFGLDPVSTAGINGASGDADGDGVTNAQEFANGTHPFGLFTRYLAEGSSNAFFDTRLALFNPGDQAGTVLVRFRQPGRAAVNTRLRPDRAPAPHRRHRRRSPASIPTSRRSSNRRSRSSSIAR